MVADSEFIIRILISACLGALVGWERERQHQPAGLRTQMILAVGCTLAMALSINLAFQFVPQGVSGDPARLAAQVVSGIGFLGAGAILHYGVNIKGMTTATSLWTVAVIGLTVGAGHYIEAVSTTILLLIILAGITIFERRYIHPFMELNISLKAEDRPGIIEEIKGVLSGKGITVQVSSINKNIDDDRITIVLLIRTMKANFLDEAVSKLSSSKGIKSFKIE
jgi:putative Mg2+ transporter-C (MgtC) family protein